MWRGAANKRRVPCGDFMFKHTVASVCGGADWSIYRDEEAIDERGTCAEAAEVRAPKGTS